MRCFKTRFFLTAVLFCHAVYCSAANRSYHDVTASSAGAPEFFEGFELDNVKLAPKFKIIRGEGVNGNRGLVYSADKPRKKVEVQRLSVELKRNWNYRLTVQFRLDNAVNHNQWKSKAREFALCGMDFSAADGKYISGRYRAIHIDPANREYQEYELEFNTPEKFDKAVVNLYMPALWTGTISFDDLSIKPCGAAPARVYQVEPKMFRPGKDGGVTLRADNIKRGSENDLRMLVEFNGKRTLYPVKNGVSKIRLDGLKKGKNMYRAAVVNNNTLELFGWHDLTVYKYDFKPAVTIDRNNYFYRNGKKFLPIGVFSHSRLLRGHHLPILRDAGCNFIMTYRAENLKVAGTGLAAANRIRAGLDLFQKNDMMLLFALNAHLKSRNSFTAFAGARGYENSIRKIAAVLKNHPALFGWYISDENPPKELPEVSLLRRLLTEGDGRHPVATLTNKVRDVADFAMTGDMIMLDDYPFVNAGSKSMTPTRKLIEANRDTRLPAILVPQAFHWGAFRKPANLYRFPTEAEIRSQSLLGMILGCRGICFYSYTAILERQENAFPGTTDNFLAGLFRITRMLKELEPFFLSEEKAPEVKITSSDRSRVDARAFVCGKKIIIPVTADGPGKADARIEISGIKGKLKSRYGLTEANSDGSYHFRATDVNSDILEGELL